MKAADYAKKTTTTAAFVATNSICQGRQVDTLWSLILSAGYEVAFAHTSFKWANLASHKAAVTVVIVGISNHLGRARHLFSEAGDGSTIVKVVDNINAYLAPAANVIVGQSSSPLSNLHEMSFGNMPNDGGYLLLEMDEARTAVRDYGVQQDFIRPFLGSQEYINGLEVRCIWVQDTESQIANRNTWLLSRFESVRAKRLASTRSTTVNLANSPHRFGEVRQTGGETVIIVPIHSSETRQYLPVGLVPAGGIISNAAYGLFDAPLWSMALIASRLHLVWVATVCGKIKTDYRYSNTLGWNTFPVPTLTEKNRADLTRCAEDILLAREAHFPATIADLYEPDSMPDDLRHAHERNDEVLERIYIGRRFKNDTERLEKLFDLYTKMTAFAPTVARGKGKARA